MQFTVLSELTPMISILFNKIQWACKSTQSGDSSNDSASFEWERLFRNFLLKKMVEQTKRKFFVGNEISQFKW